MAEITSIARVINSKIRASGYSSWELFTRRSTVDNKPVVKTDEELSDQKFATKLSHHTPPVTIPKFEVGDLVMVKAARSKLHPRETYIVQSWHNDNGNLWVEIYKMGSKITSKSQFVKAEDLLPLPKRQQRQSAVNARKKIQEALPHIMAILKTKPPTHAWDFDTLMKLLDSDLDDDLEEEAEYPPTLHQDAQVLMDKDKGEEMDKQKPPQDLNQTKWL